ncbi:MAG TPA: hypothetical protein VKB51_07265 [bacterium]|nr:hypothetical protein [bacterium]
MLKRAVVAVLLASAVMWVAVPSALALGCMEQVQNSEKLLAKVTEEAKSARDINKPRIEGFLDNARILLKQALEDCKTARSEVDKAVSISKVALAEGNLGAARVFIKLD